MTKIKFFIVLFVLAIILSGCNKEKETFVPKTSPYEKESGISFGLNYNNQLEVNEIVKEQFPLLELYEYFGDSTISENRIWENKKQDSNSLEIDAINQRFKIECYRHSEKFDYIVFKVKEGGYYYIFLGKSQDKTPVVREHIYINKLRNEEDFKGVKLNKKRTYDDVKKIDPSVELYVFTSTGPYSYSLLSNGKVLSFSYKVTKDKQSNVVLVVNDRKIFDKEESICYLTQIMDKDLPSAQSFFTVSSEWVHSELTTYRLK